VVKGSRFEKVPIKRRNIRVKVPIFAMTEKKERGENKSFNPFVLINRTSFTDHKLTRKQLGKEINK